MISKKQTQALTGSSHIPVTWASVAYQQPSAATDAAVLSPLFEPVWEFHNRVVHRQHFILSLAFMVCVLKTSHISICWRAHIELLELFWKGDWTVQTLQPASGTSLRPAIDAIITWFTFWCLHLEDKCIPLSWGDQQLRAMPEDTRYCVSKDSQCVQLVILKCLKNKHFLLLSVLVQPSRRICGNFCWNSVSVLPRIYWFTCCFADFYIRALAFLAPVVLRAPMGPLINKSGP